MDTIKGIFNSFPGLARELIGFAIPGLMFFGLFYLHRPQAIVPQLLNFQYISTTERILLVGTICYIIGRLLYYGGAMIIRPILSVIISVSNKLNVFKQLFHDTFGGWKGISLNSTDLKRISEVEIFEYIDSKKDVSDRFERVLTSIFFLTATFCLSVISGVFFSGYYFIASGILMLLLIQDYSDLQKFRYYILHRIYKLNHSKES